MTLKPCSLKPIVTRVIAGLQKQAQDKDVAINVEIPKDIPDILADEARIAQVLLNLVDNAIKYNQRKGTITISAKEENTFVETSISDDGIGISEPKVNNIPL